MPDKSHSARNLVFGPTGSQHLPSPERVTGLKTSTSRGNAKGASLAMAFYQNHFNFITYEIKD